MNNNDCLDSCKGNNWDTSAERIKSVHKVVFEDDVTQEIIQDYFGHGGPKKMEVDSTIAPSLSYVKPAEKTLPDVVVDHILPEQ